MCQAATALQKLQVRSGVGDYWAAPHRPASLVVASCPALRPKKESRDSDRDINGLLDRGILHKGSWSETPPSCAADSGQDTAVGFATRGEEVTI